MEKEFESWLKNTLDDNCEVEYVSNFKECGVLSLNKGLCIKTKLGEFQLTIVQI